MRHWLAAMIASSSRIVNIDEDTTIHYAHIRIELKLSGQTHSVKRYLDSGTVPAILLPVVSRDRHFDFVQGLKRIAW